MPKRKNPQTSLDAYKSLDPNQLNRTYRNILYALARIKEGTFEDISKQMGVKPEVVWKRLSELQNAGLIYRPGNKKPLSSKKLGYTWMVVTPGVSPTKVVEMSMLGKSVSDYSKEIGKISQAELF